MKKVLFACTENKKRSQIAEAIFNHLMKEKRWTAVSGGTMPAESIDPFTIAVLQESGIATEQLKPKKVTQEMMDGADIIVSFGCLVPSMFLKEKFREWIIDDPQTIEDFRRIYDQLKIKIQALIQEIE